MRLAVLASMAVLSFSVVAHAQAPSATATKPAPQAPDVAAPKLGPDGNVNEGFAKSHENFVKTAKEGTAQLVFIGDSITAGWARQKDIWDKAFGQYKPANFGIGGDRTQHVLWRITNGELDGIEPKAVVLMIGTNNVSSDSAEGIARGITRIVETIRNKQPQAKILLLAVFPRGEKAENNPARDKIKQINEQIAKLDDGKNIFYLDIGDKFLEKDGSISKEIMPDYLHLSAEGYQRWADAISPKLAELMK
ncbi:MAG: platelet-activating factor acetylhydrolase IB subunit [Aureliella sp.]